MAAEAPLLAVRMKENEVRLDVEIAELADALFEMAEERGIEACLVHARGGVPSNGKNRCSFSA